MEKHEHRHSAALAGGLYYLFLTPSGRRYRLIGWMYLIPLALFFVARDRDYYLAPAYPMLFAGGALGGEKWVEPLPATRANAVHGTTWQAMAIAGALTAAILLPIAPPNSVWWRIADNLQGNFHYEFGWREMTDAVARVRDSLPTRDRSRLGVLAADAGEAGALNLHGPAYGLPTAISRSNSHWLGGYGDPSSADPDCGRFLARGN